MLCVGREQFVLNMLTAGEMYGLDLVKASGGLLKRGTIYVLLADMEDRGLIRRRKVGLGPFPRTLYSLQAPAKDPQSAKHSAKL